MLPDAVKEHIDKIKDLEFTLQAEPEQLQKLHMLRRKLELGYHDHLKQGTRVAVQKGLTIECQKCGALMMDSDHLYLHLRQKHDVTEEEAGELSTEATRKHTDDLLKLGSLLGEYTEVLLEDEFSKA